MIDTCVSKILKDEDIIPVRHCPPLQALVSSGRYDKLGVDRGTEMCSSAQAGTACTLLFAVCVFALGAHGYQFQMEGSARRCFDEEIPLSADVLVTYTAVQGSGEATVSLKITDMNGKVIHSQDHLTSGKHGFKTADTLPYMSKEDSWSMKDDDRLDQKAMDAVGDSAGDNRLKYKFCFEQRQSGMHMPHLHAVQEPLRRIIFSVNFGADSKTKEYYDQLAKEKHLSNTEEMFKVVEDLVAEVVKEIDEMRQRERRMVLLNKKTNGVVLWYSAFACFFVIGGAFISSYATRSFLSTEKLL